MVHSGLKSILMRYRPALITLPLLAGTIIIFILSWLPDPVLGKYGFLPGWLAHWTDAGANDNLRTAVPFLFLGFFTGGWLLLTKKEWRWWLIALVGLVSIAFIAEAGQLTLPRRNFDWGDVAWGTMGTLSGLGVAAVSYHVIRFVAKHLKGYR